MNATAGEALKAARHLVRRCKRGHELEDGEIQTAINHAGPEFHWNAWCYLVQAFLPPSPLPQSDQRFLQTRDRGEGI